MDVNFYGFVALLILTGGLCYFAGFGVGWQSGTGQRHKIFAQTEAMKKAYEGSFSLTAAEYDVLTERVRQIEEEGRTPEHDDLYRGGELATAAACYAGNAGGFVWWELGAKSGWPGALLAFDHKWWKPSTPRRDLVKAGALILAEIDRIDRAARATLAASEKGGA